MGWLIVILVLSAVAVALLVYAVRGSGRIGGEPMPNANDGLFRSTDRRTDRPFD